MEKIRKNYPDIAPSGPTYSRGVRVGNLLFISGCTARGTEAQGKAAMEQLRVTLDRIARIMKEEGGATSDIVKITTFVTSISDWRAHQAEQEALFAEYFQGDISGQHVGGDHRAGGGRPGRGDRSNRRVELNRAPLGRSTEFQQAKGIERWQRWYWAWRLPIAPSSARLPMDGPSEASGIRATPS